MIGATADIGAHRAAVLEATSCDMLRQKIPWEVASAFQIANVWEKDENFIQEVIRQLKKMINYATAVLSDCHLREQFEF